MLNQFTIQNAKRREKPYKLADGNGLHLLIQPGGGKLWRFRYRFAGKENMLALGSFPEITIADARERRDTARKQLANGIDPSQQKKQDKLAASFARQNTFGAIAAEIIDRLEAENAVASTISKNKWLLQDLASPLTKRPITEITAAEILDLLKKVEKSGRRETAHRLRGSIGTVFRHAVVTQRATTDPTFALRGALLTPVVQHRAAIIDERELGTLMGNIDNYDGWPTIRAALQLLALTMTRPGDVRLMRRSEIIFPRALWRIPAERMKMRRPHDVPLSKQALAIIGDIWPLSEGHDLVLPSVRSARKPLSEGAMISALRRMGYSKEEVSPHGLRSSASTILNDRGFDPDVIEAALAHQDEDEIRRVYNRGLYLPQRIKLMQAWADLLDEFRAFSTVRASA